MKAVIFALSLVSAHGFGYFTEDCGCFAAIYNDPGTECDHTVCDEDYIVDGYADNCCGTDGYNYRDTVYSCGDWINIDYTYEGDGVDFIRYNKNGCCMEVGDDMYIDHSEWEHEADAGGSGEVCCDWVKNV